MNETSPVPAAAPVPPRRSLAAPIALGLAVVLLAGVAVKRMLDRDDPGTGAARADDDPNRPRSNVLADFGPIGDFTLIDTDGRQFGRAQLLGKIWVADFVFTSCSGPCLPMTQGLRTVVQDLLGEPDVEFVTITVDPETDTPDVLRNYAAARGATSPRWHWLTGEKATILKLVNESFLSPVGDKLPDGQVPHSTRFFVVDRHGRLRMMHDTKSVVEPGHEPIRDVVGTVRALLQQQPPPTPEGSGPKASENKAAK